jgi:hypothetical protein
MQECNEEGEQLELDIPEQQVTQPRSAEHVTYTV